MSTPIDRLPIPLLQRRTLMTGMAGFAASMATLAPSRSALAVPVADYPNRPVRLVVSYPPGGVGDTIGRIIATGLSATLKQTVFVENRGGAGGTLGAAAVAKAAPDGYTLLLTFPPMVAVAPALLKSLPYDAKDDFTPIGTFATTPNILVVNAGLPVRTLADLADYAKGEGRGKLSYGSAGPGSTGHLYGQILCTAMGIEMTHIPYKSSGLAFPDVIAGRVSMVFDSVPSTIGYVRAGTVRPIAVMSEQRASLLPDVPTTGEAGYPGASMAYWIGLEAPRGLPPELTRKLDEAISAAVHSPETQKQLAAVGAEPFLTSAEEYARLRAHDIERLHRLVADLGLRAE
ncbi:tripartite tricarboxylate transporter substrate binding protein BugE [Pigmentiphaga soli]|uniref:Tripartite tricarboxylate transporter substrate binding protein BugE n=1 Tax=Pigmentiphaga soli TaxID=1007095 RepID=A0ABP8H4A6_9BURK